MFRKCPQYLFKHYQHRYVHGCREITRHVGRIAQINEVRRSMVYVNKTPVMRSERSTSVSCDLPFCLNAKTAGLIP